ncbi:MULTISPECIES: cupin domain-containing protein [unclassified Streptomyces]|uniref:cupin domain-containing protein n=1 Tax=unclassified Streptomyces TaxID=2593676 RepID=UPI001BE96869|nr:MULTISPECIES: cupin domain-containing protein [unclassified Streptomyces]MBT2402289.1 cupin domain-containing protein [Streptomyces sp. ISL-21]MBT2458590.1 cupin domain-containing protein [Streptomyces sp. ISL-86]MBT2606764.1 cupin domain-containing protein [Streptomyces sp. ISL-87]
MGGRQATARRPRAAEPADLEGREIVIEPGGCTGWHYHRVQLMAVVKSGTLTRILHDNTVEVHRTGTSFVEPEGIRHIHLGRNLGTEPVVLYVTCDALPEGAPFSIPTPAPPGAAACACPGRAP